MWWRFFKKKTSLPPLKPEGEVHNLSEIFQAVNAGYFDAKLDLRITWFGRGNIPRTRILYGSYHHLRKEVRVNRILDQEKVPRSVVEFIVYHEMLHHVLPPRRGKNGRRNIHHQEFKEKEREFEHFMDAKTFLARFI